MQAGSAQIGRTILAAVTAAVLVASMAVLIANPADASGDGSPAACETGVQAGGSQEVRTYTAPSGKIVEGVCIKSGSQQFGGAKHSGVLGNGTHDGGCYEVSGVGTQTVTITNVGGYCQGLSHVDVILGDQTTTTSSQPTTTSTTEATTSTSAPTTTSTSEATTTSTSAPTTTSTSEATTTTTEATTTTTEATTTTTEESTTSTEPEVPSQVGALVFVTVEGICEVDGVKGEGKISISVSVDDAATVVVRNSNGSVVANVSSDAVITVPEGATYTWEATPNEGFEFAEDFVSSDEVEIETCTKDEVKDLEVLPFTGIETDSLAAIAAVLSAIGLLVLLAVRRVEE
jgi:hypothetical protein